MGRILRNDWEEHLLPEFEKDYYKKLKKFLIKEYSSYRIFPPMEEIYNAFHFTSLNDLKVVILGQDPYHGIGQAHGLAFSVKVGTDIPPSLKNIYKELNEDIGCFIPNNGYLKKWTDEGVLMLNTVLTVRSGQANSHKDKGWEMFTNRVIEIINEQDKPLVFLLWGRNAQAKESMLNNKKHLVIKTPHPSPLSASRGFMGSRCFSRCNDFLVKNGVEPVDWQIENV